MSSWAESVAAATLDAVSTVDGAVELLPHQHIPASGFAGHVLLAGRGAGKTKAVMHWLNGRCWDEPGLRARVIAPTSGDGVASCVEGVDGLLELSHQRATFNAAAPGGSCVTYPNGSKVWVIGTPTPKDVDRLRALTNITCLVASTLILTRRGEVPIPEVTAGDHVMTRRGWRRVLWSGQTGVRGDLYRLMTRSGRTLTGTSDHRVWTARGWQPLAFLKTGDSLPGCLTSSSTVGNTTSVRRGDIGTTHRVGLSTSTSGNTTTGLYPTGAMCTTSTTMSTTTTSTTWWSWNGPSTTDTTCGSMPTPPSTENGRPKFSLIGGGGTKAQLRSASSAGRSSAIATHPQPAFVFAPSAATNGTGCGNGQDLSLSTPSAWFADRPFAPDGTPPLATHQSPATDLVLRSTPIPGAEPVYDLMVEGEHEFYANGVLVHNCDVFEEAAANPQLAAAVQQAALSRRRGDPRWVAATTPRPHPVIKKWIADPKVNVVRATMADNPHLPEAYRDYAETLKGTRLYQQEVLGEVVEDVEGALWTWGDIERSRVDSAPDLERIVVSVDPAVGSGTTGIIVAGIADGIIHVLADASLTDVSPATWASRVAREHEKWGASGVVVEDNQGGRLVVDTLQSADLTMPIQKVTARVGKEARAMPVAVLWEADDQRARIVGSMPQLETQMCEWTPGSFSPDRIDALVHGVTHLRGRSHGLVEIQGPEHQQVVDLSGFRRRRLGA